MSDATSQPPLRVLLVDDEAPARSRLRRLLQPYLDDGSIGTVDEASDNISAERVRMLEDNLPPVRWSFTANHTNGDWRVMGRLNYYGSIYEDHLDSALPIDKVSSEVTVDLEVGYHFSEDLQVVLGAKNALDEYPDENVQYDTEVAGAAYPVTSPIGINGGFYYLRGIYTF